MTELCAWKRGALLATLVAAAALACKPASEAPVEATPSPAASTAAAEVPLPAEAKQAAEAITPDVLRAPIAELASDAYGGRGPGEPGDPKTRDYLAQQMQQIGLQPGAADGSWTQTFDIVGIEASAPKAWSFATGDGKKASFAWNDDYIAGSGVQEPKAAVKDAEVVFVGYGIQAPEYQWDDFKGQDLKGKILLMMNNDPDWDPNLFAGERRLYYGRWTYKYESAARQGAAGAIIIHTTPSAGYPFQVVQTSWTGEQFELPRENEPRVQLKSWMTEDAARRLAELGGKKLDELIDSAKKREFQPVPLGIRTSLALANKVRRVQTANVIGKLPGRDPQLGQQAVIYTAHHDHLGVGTPDDKGDTIYNGAMDNASGCSQILAIARAFKALPQAPRRTVMFAFVAAEEQGLLGSKYLAEHPPIPAGRLAANVNFDGGDIWGKTKDITFVGVEKSSLGDVVRRFASEQGREVKPDQFPDRGFYYRSDQFSFAKVGIPGIYLDTGTDFVGRPPGWGKEQVEKYEEECYHQPCDELKPDWNFDGMVDDARLGFYSGLWIAEQDEMPTWVPGDEFEAARREAIAEAEGGGAPAAASPAASPAATTGATDD